MIPVGDILVANDIATTCFACDVARCRGACCTIPGGSGAPLLEEELFRVDSVAAVLFDELRPEAQAVIRKKGSWEAVGRDAYATSCVGNRECVFVVYEGRLAKCAIQKAHMEGRISWIKPLSCHLFPIRVSRFGESESINYEPIEACRPAIDRGRRERRRLETFLREALVRAFGSAWYEDFLAACKKKRYELRYTDKRSTN